MRTEAHQKFAYRSDPFLSWYCSILGYLVAATVLAVAIFAALGGAAN